MRKYIFINAAILMLSLLSCDRDKNVTVIKFEDFNEIIDVKGEVVQLEDTLVSIMQVLTIDSLLICYDKFNSGCMINIYNKNDFSYIKGYAKKGKGPLEYQNPGPLSLDYEKKEIYLTSLKKFISIINIDSLLHFEGYTANKTELEFSDLNLAGFVRHQSRDEIFSSGIEQVSDIVVYNRKTGGIIRKFGEPYIEKKPNYPKRGFANMLFHNVYANFTQKKVAATHVFQDRICFYSMEGESLFDTFGPDHFEPKIGFTKNYYKYKHDENKAYASTGDSSDEYLFLPYHGKPGMKKHQSRRPEMIRSNTIHIFDWEGTPIVKLNVDRDIYSLAFDSDNYRLICVDRSVEQQLYTIDVSFLKNQDDAI